MLHSPLARPRRLTIAMVLVLAVIATACSGGIRPTLTGDRLDESGLPAAADAQVESAIDQAGDATETTTPPAPDPDSTAQTTEATAPIIDGVEQLTVQVLETLPHDPGSFTQGLELHNGDFFESTGARGPDNVLSESTLRRVDPATGVVEQTITIEQPYFAEGLTLVGDQLIQLTWQSMTAFYWNADSFELEKEVSYIGEGWGLCYDGNQLIMTDGTPNLIFRDPTTFQETSRIRVTIGGEDVTNLNELECVDGVVWANVWLTDQIVRIDPATGNVTGIVDASALDRPLGDGNAVLNGIAWDATSQSFYVTGKLWPSMYRVNFVATPAS